MKFVFYFFIIAQFLSFLGVFAEKFKEGSSELNPIKWEKVRENEEKTLKKIIWKSYKDDKSYFEKTNLKNKSKENFNKAHFLASKVIFYKIFSNLVFYRCLL